MKGTLNYQILYARIVPNGWLCKMVVGLLAFQILLLLEREFIKGFFYIFLPKVHQSTGFPWPILKRISGAKYSGVPQTD